MSLTNSSQFKNDCIEKVKFINLLDRGDRLGANISWYISTILVAIKNSLKICFIKPKTEYSYYNSIFVEALFDFVEDYNEIRFGNATGYQNDLMIQDDDYFLKIIESIINIKCDFVTAFKECVFEEKFKEKLNKLAKTRNYIIPYNREKTICVHLRLDDKQDCFVSNEDRTNHSMNFRNIIDNDDINYTFPGFSGQSAIKEDEILKIINKALNIYKDYEVIIITNGKHTLPYKTINSEDESYDLFLLCNSTILIGSMSTFSFTSIYFGNHTSVYYPLWEHAVCFGLTTKYDKTNIINLF